MASEIVRLGMIGAGGWAHAGHLAFHIKNPRVRLVAVCDVMAERAEQTAAEYGAPFATTAYQDILNRVDIDAVDIATPNVTHAPIVLAALKSGKHVICEKPMAMNLEEAKSMVRAAGPSGLKATINFVYRCHPAVQFARHLVHEGHIGTIFQVNAAYLQGWLINPQIPLMWRLQKDISGTGVLGDLGSHLVDLVEWITAERINSVVADMKTYVRERPLPDGSGMGQVDVDDGVNFQVRFEAGAMGSFVCSRYAAGSQNNQRVEIYGEKGSLIFDVNDVDHILASLDPVSVKEGRMTTVPVPSRFKSRDSSSLFARQNRAGHLNAFVEAILEDKDVRPNFQEGLRNQAILEAIEISARERRWVDIAD